MNSAYDFEADAIDGTRISLDVFRGEVLLIVNVASFCGYTSQYEGLEELYRAYRERGFSVLAFPCNQFGLQEPGTDADIRAFCSLNFDVTFPMFAKVDVNGAHEHPLFRFLKSQRKSWLGSGIKWNFTKFLVDRKGQVRHRYGPTETPSKIQPDIERALRLDVVAG